LAALSRSRQGPQVSAPGPGNQADGITQLKSAIDIIQSALPLLGTGTPMHSAALNALRQLTRHVAQGGQAAAGTQQTNLQDLLRATVRNALLQRVMAGQQGGGGGPPGAGGPPGGGAPSPATPFPGA
jgi:hypothetical protein